MNKETVLSIKLKHNKDIELDSYFVKAEGLSGGGNGIAAISGVKISKMQHDDGSIYIKLQPYTTKGKPQVDAKLIINKEAFDILCVWYTLHDSMKTKE